MQEKERGEVKRNRDNEKVESWAGYILRNHDMGYSCQVYERQGEGVTGLRVQEKERKTRGSQLTYSKIEKGEGKGEPKSERLGFIEGLAEVRKIGGGPGEETWGGPAQPGPAPFYLDKEKQEKGQRRKKRRKEGAAEKRRGTRDRRGRLVFWGERQCHKKNNSFLKGKK